MPIEIPSFEWTALYYPEILEALFGFKRTNVPELTNESAQEPLVQMMRAFACVGHLNNTLADLVANESTLPTARLPETVRNMLRLIDFEMPSARPSTTDLIYELAQVIGTSVVAISQFAQAGTRPSVDQPARFFEALEALTVTPTNALTKCFRVEDDGLGPVYTDFTTEANDVGGPFTAWASPLGGSATREGDSLLFGHSEAMWKETDIDINTAMAGIIGVWEYYDGNPRKTKPTSVVDNGINLTLNINSYLGTASLQGTPIRITYNPTGAFEDRFSYFASGVNKVDSASLFGQSVPSTNPADYTVGSVWERFTGLTDNTINAGVQLAQDGKVQFDLPQTLTANWSLGAFNGQTAFWKRFRIISVAGPTAPSINRIRIDTGKQYLKRQVTQGQTVDEVLGSSDASPNQSFTTSKENVILNTDSVFVADVQWTRVDSFLSSRATDRHYRVQLEEGDRARIFFGDGLTGAIPVAGVSNIRAVYRFDAALDGNVGANTIVNDRTGLTLVASLFNPRPAAGWAQAAGATEESLEQVKVDGPASLRTLRDIALGPDDVEILARQASTIDPTQITVTRAKSIEEGFGPKTIELIVVSAGGALASADDLDELSEFFNGNQFVSPVKKKRIVANQEVTAVNYNQRVINVTATVYARGAVTSTQIVNALLRLLQPEALREDGVTFEWEFGDRIPTSRLAHEIFEVDGSIYDVDIITPASDIVLLTRELPVPGTLTITVLP